MTTEVEKAKENFEIAKARLQKAQAMESSRNRKRDNKRKIVIGGALLKRAETDLQAWVILKELTDSVQRPADRKAFEEWKMPERPGGES